MSIIGLGLISIGLWSLLVRRSFLSMLVGFQILFTGAALTLALSAGAAKLVNEVTVFVIFVLLMSLVQTVIGFGLLLRLEYLRMHRSPRLLKSLRHLCEDSTQS